MGKLSEIANKIRENKEIDMSIKQIDSLIRSAEKEEDTKAELERSIRGEQSGTK